MKSCARVQVASSLFDKLSVFLRSLRGWNQKSSKLASRSDAKVLKCCSRFQ